MIELSVEGNNFSIHCEIEGQALTSLRQLPYTPGVYIIKKNEKVVYVGSSVSLWMRFNGNENQNHHILTKAIEGDQCTLEFMEMLDTTYEELRMIEGELYDQYEPEWNEERPSPHRVASAKVYPNTREGVMLNEMAKKADVEPQTKLNHIVREAYQQSDEPKYVDQTLVEMTPEQALMCKYQAGVLQKIWEKFDDEYDWSDSLIPIGSGIIAKISTTKNKKYLCLEMEELKEAHPELVDTKLEFDYSNVEAILPPNDYPDLYSTTYKLNTKVLGKLEKLPESITVIEEKRKRITF
jgi:hypothetical protein